MGKKIDFDMARWLALEGQGLKDKEIAHAFQVPPETLSRNKKDFLAYKARLNSHDDESAIADDLMIPEITGPLSEVERQGLEEDEKIIERGLEEFVQVGSALMDVRMRRLYRETHSTFEAYARERWNLSKPYAYQLMAASQVVDNVKALNGHVPMNEAQARPLTALSPADQLDTWMEVIHSAPPEGITAKHIKGVITSLKSRLPAKPVTVKPAERPALSVPAWQKAGATISELLAKHEQEWPESMLLSFIKTAEDIISGRKHRGDR
jgi:hypothetical protein